MNNFYTGMGNSLRYYKVHLLIFLIALFIAVTFAHPSMLITDEWITVNQLSQLHDGHQIIVNEGKYGSLEDGSPSTYFTMKNNYLAYPLILPLISLPAYWLLDILGGLFIFFIMYIWTFLLIAIGLLLNAWFKEYTCIGKYRWTTGFFIATFVLFFINLFVYRSFPIFGKDTYPEIIAIVLTNIVLFAILAVMIYELCRTIFKDPGYTLFGTVVCLSCSSYIFWTNFCKDHILVAFLFVAIVLMTVKFLTGTHDWCLPGAFVITGLLAWARPELALFVFFVVCVFVVYLYVTVKSRFTGTTNKNLLLLSPVFTLIGAVPFFINNYLFTKNIFVPAWILWKTEPSSAAVAVSGSVPVQPAYSDTLGSLLRLFVSTINIQPATFVSDLYGVMLNPQSVSMGVLPLVPLFMVALLILPLFWVIEKIHFNPGEKLYIVTMTLLALGVFLAYARGLSGMNISVGIVPDMRYLSPIYLPLNILGLMVIRKIPSISDKPRELLTWMGATWVIVLPITLVLISLYYPPAEDWANVFPLLDALTSVAIFLLALLFLLSLIANRIYKISATPAKIFVALLCAVPFIWQIDATYLARIIGAGLGGYSFWIPVMLKIFGIVF